jgi:Fe-S cluster assembly scaffold protein SufB
VGEIDETQVFYMMTRGIPRREAVRILVEGYFEPVVQVIEDESLAELVRGRISDKLQAAEEEVAEYVMQR